MGKYDNDDDYEDDDRGRAKNAKRKPVRAEYDDDEEDEDDRDRAKSPKRKPVRAEYDDEEDEDRDSAKSSKRKPVRAEYDEEDEDEDDYEERPKKKRRPEKRLRPGRCPQCSSSRSSGVHFTWWGGFIGPMIFGLVRCNRCGQEYSKGSGKPFGFMQILIYSLVVGGIAGVIGITLAILGG